MPSADSSTTIPASPPVVRVEPETIGGRRRRFRRHCVARNVQFVHTVGRVREQQLRSVLKDLLHDRQFPSRAEVAPLLQRRVVDASHDDRHPAHAYQIPDKECHRPGRCVDKALLDSREDGLRVWEYCRGPAPSRQVVQEPNGVLFDGLTHLRGSVRKRGRLGRSAQHDQRNHCTGGRPETLPSRCGSPTLLGAGLPSANGTVCRRCPTRAGRDRPKMSYYIILDSIRKGYWRP